MARSQEMYVYRPHARSSLRKPLLDRVRISLLGAIGGFRVWIVDGEFLRDHVDIDFTVGGNPSRYRYVPPGEIWIEHGLSPSDAAPTIVHELVEMTLMRTRRTNYDRAHDMANAVERKIRRRIVRGEKIRTRGEAMRLARVEFEYWTRTQAQSFAG